MNRHTGGISDWDWPDAIINGRVNGALKRLVYLAGWKPKSFRVSTEIVG